MERFSRPQSGCGSEQLSADNLQFGLQDLEQTAAERQVARNAAAAISSGPPSPQAARVRIMARYPQCSALGCGNRGMDMAASSGWPGPGRPRQERAAVDHLCVRSGSRGRWRREWDSNPRYALTHTRFPSVRLKPLGHPSAGGGKISGRMAETSRQKFFSQRLCWTRTKGTYIYPFSHSKRVSAHPREENTMAWTRPTIREICIGMEINGYLPAEI